VEIFDILLHASATRFTPCASSIQHLSSLAAPPHQLRHTAMTRAAKEFGIEIAKAATGHAHISTTQIYAERDLDAAKKVALKFG